MKMQTLLLIPDKPSSPTKHLTVPLELPATSVFMLVT